MRTIECLAHQYPDKTGTELIAMQAQDKLDDQKAFEKHNKKKLAFMNDLNTNGGYYRGRFGYDQRYFYCVSDVQMDSNGELWGNVESVVVFMNNENVPNIVTRGGEVRLERRTKEYVQLDNYGLQDEQRVSKVEWDGVNAYINGIEVFWADIKMKS
jgi:hypothetical protein